MTTVNGLDLLVVDTKIPILVVDTKIAILVALGILDSPLCGFKMSKLNK